MRKFVPSTIVTRFIVVGVCAGLMNVSARASADHQAVLQTERAFISALAQGNKSEVSRLLDSGFQWTSDEGKTQNKSEALDSLSKLAVDDQGDTDVTTYYYSELALVWGRHDKSWFSRIWVKRSTGWRLFMDMDTPISPKRAPTSGGGPKPGPIGDCVNPCRVIPYTPTTAADKAVIAGWQKAKVDEWHPNIKDWTTQVAPEFIIITYKFNGAINNATRVAIGKKRQKDNIGIPGDPILSMNMYDFGDAVVMTARHRPYYGGKPYHNLRLFVHRNGHWEVVLSQQTLIQSAAPLPPVSSGK